MAARKKDEAPQNFEDAMQRLDAIVAKLEEDKLPLDEMLARYCGEKLEAAEQKVRLIAQKADGTVTLEEFDDGEET